MKALLIDTSNETCLVLFFENQKVLYQATIPKETSNSRFVTQEIENGTKALGLSLSELDCIAIGVGPGSYTGVRVGVTIAKVLSYAHHLPLVSICSLDGFIPKKDGQFISIIDAKSGGAYYQIGEKKEGAIYWLSSPELSPLDQIAKLDSIKTLVCPKSKLLKIKLEKVFNEKFIWIDSEPNVDHLIAEAIRKFENKETTDYKNIQILYLRETQAEIERKAKNICSDSNP